MCKFFKHKVQTEPAERGTQPLPPPLTFPSFFSDSCHNLTPWIPSSHRFPLQTLISLAPLHSHSWHHLELRPCTSEALKNLFGFINLAWCFPPSLLRWESWDLRWKKKEYTEIEQEDRNFQNLRESPHSQRNLNKLDKERADVQSRDYHYLGIKGLMFVSEESFIICHSVTCMLLHINEKELRRKVIGLALHIT